MRDRMERAATPGSALTVAVAMAEVVGGTAVCAWAAVTQPHHLIAGVAAVLAFVVFSLLASLQLAAARTPRRPPADIGRVDGDAQVERVRRAAEQLAARAQLGDVRVVAAPAMLAGTRVRLARGGAVVAANPALVAGRDDGALLGTLALQVAATRVRPRQAMLALALGAWMMAACLLPFVPTMVLTHDYWLAVAVTFGFGGVLLVAGGVVVFRATNGPRRMQRLDADAVHLAGGAEPVRRALEAGAAQDEETATRVAEYRGLLWPARVLMQLAVGRGRRVWRQRMEELRRAEAPGA